ncbi:unnamed protein product [Phytophthora fragariaefolia]|uniref:Unnamed protein product n=1 Tax=Phytophthora fragariaefolia TaxID=1490495 RepID=A0A9W6Y243_9STRA|nr:unnamed protein product [Phytophthora fragariaefolia]
MLLSSLFRSTSTTSVAAQHIYENHACIFDGKLGTWPFVVHTLAERTSVNRPVGTPLVKAVTATQENYRAMLIDKRLPAILSKRPGGGRGTRIRIQQDNASPHIDPKDSAFCAAVSALDLNVALKFQPPNSPDLNCLDLEAFNAIQARQQLRSPHALAELVAATGRSWLPLRRDPEQHIPLATVRYGVMHSRAREEHLQAHAHGKSKAPSGGKTSFDDCLL